jgi:hypothetical protein
MADYRVGALGMETSGGIEVTEAGQVAERVRVRDLTNDQGNRRRRILRPSSGSVVTWRRVQMVLLSAQAMEVAAIATATFTSHDRVREVLHNLQAGRVRLAVSALCRQPTARPHPRQRCEIRQVALSRPQDYELPVATWSLRGWPTS